MFIHPLVILPSNYLLDTYSIKLGVYIFIILDFYQLHLSHYGSLCQNVDRIWHNLGYYWKWYYCCWKCVSNSNFIKVFHSLVPKLKQINCYKPDCFLKCYFWGNRSCNFSHHRKIRIRSRNWKK